MLQVKYLLFIFLFLTQLAHARVVLLTSFHKTSEETKTEKIFKKRFPKDELSKVEIIHKADQWALYQTLLNPEVKAVFWVSHGVSATRPIDASGGAGILPKLLDYRGDNIAPVFGLIQPSLKFVSIIGCDSARILEENNVQLGSLVSYVPVKKRVALHLQVRRSIKAYETMPQIEAQLSEPLLSQGHVLIQRDVEKSDETRSLRVILGGKLIGLIPAQRGEFLLPVPKGIGSLKIKIESGQNAADDQAPIGDLNVSSPDILGSWRIFANLQGIPFGVNHRVFTYRP